jgi:hypothetical protein
LAVFEPLDSSKGSHKVRPEGGGKQCWTVTVWLQFVLWPHVSVMVQVRVSTKGQGPLLVTVLKVTL